MIPPFIRNDASNAARIVSADEARALLEGTTEGPWDFLPADAEDEAYVSQASAPHEDVALVLDVTDADGRLFAAAPDLAATVVHLHAELARLRAVVAAVREERAARLAWLSSLPPGACTSPPTEELLAAEERTAEELDALDAAIAEGGAR